MEVAVPQSNIILKDIMGGRSSVNTHTGSVGVAVPQSNTIIMKSGGEECKSMLCKRMNNEQCQACGMKSVSVSLVVKQFQSESVSPDVRVARVTDRVKTGVKVNQPLKSKVRPASTSSSTSRLREYFSKLATNNKLEGKLGHGCENNLTTTPTKRKICENSEVTNPVPKHMPTLSNQFVVSPGESSAVFSPAKRSRCEKKSEK